MSVTGEIKNLYSDKDKTRVLLPRTKTKAVSDENGTSLDVLLDGKAPAGYGVGSEAYHLSPIMDANIATANGWYLLEKEAANGINHRGVMRVDAYSSTELMQTLYTTHASNIYPTLMQRMCIRGNWSEWEWVNPPMMAGVEYRTTERYDGKPVYVKLVNCGALPNKTTKQVAFLNDGSKATSIVRYSAYIANGNYTQIYSLPYTLNSVNWCIQAIDNVAINLYTSYEASSGLTAYVTVWYTKD